MIHAENANKELLEASRSGELTVERLEELAGMGANAFLKAFQAAAAAGYMESLTILLESNKVEAGDSDELGYTALHKAQKPQIAKLLLEHGATPDAPNLHARYTPLHFAVMARNEELVMCLLDYKPDVNCSTIHGVTPLHQAQSQVVVEALIKNGADINALTREHQQTPLHWAVIHQNEEVVRALVEAGADISLQDKEEKKAADALPSHHPLRLFIEQSAT